uniref:Mu opioid receptor isoform MOR-1Ha n=1 Tax=Mus musculus TaxID=10090 RepID=Q4U2P9_MOUSE|nr:mu opioid receptor isoform MOR-1Ha [Mus musculus]
MMEAFSKSAFQKLRQRDGNQEGKSYLRACPCKKLTEPRAAVRGRGWGAWNPNTLECSQLQPTESAASIQNHGQQRRPREHQRLL